MREITCKDATEARCALVGSESDRIAFEHGASLDVLPLVRAKAESLVARGYTVKVVCAGESIAWGLRGRGFDLQGCEVLTVREAAIDVLSSCRRSVGRGASLRILDENEMDVLVEDMKTSGIKPRRLREMLGFFFRSIADRSAEVDGWLVSGEERAVWNLLTANLEARGAFLPWEVSSAACCLLEGEHEGYVAPDVVIAVGYDAMSRSSQDLVGLMPGQAMVAFAERDGLPIPDEPYPNRDGLSRVVEGRPEGIVLTVDSAECPKAERLRATRPLEEFELVASKVALYTSESNAPTSVLVAVPNRVWGERIAQCLDGKGVPALFVGGSRKVEGDPRDPNRCSALMGACALRLLAYPGDAVALRGWIGLGDWLVRSNLFLRVFEALDASPGASMESVLREAACDERGLLSASESSHVAERLSLLDEVARASAGKTGLSLVETLESFGMAVPERARRLAMRDGSVSAQGLDAALRSSALPMASGEVIVAPYALCRGLKADLVVIAGAVGGFVPSRSALDEGAPRDLRERELERGRRLFDGMVSCALRRVVLSGFTEDRLDNAEPMGLAIERIVAQRGEVVARIAPSPFVEELMEGQECSSAQEAV